MPAQIGFTLITHRCPEQIVRLCRRLADEFGGPPIAIHHDFSRSGLVEGDLPGCARVVRDWHLTRWGGISLVEAYLKALRLLYEFADPQWSTLLSGSDYPIQTAQFIADDLATTPANVLMDYRTIQREYRGNPEARSPSIRTYERPAWMDTAYERYIATRISSYKVMALLGHPDTAIYLRGSLSRRLLTPFRGGLQPYGGDFWHTLDRRAAGVLLADSAVKRKLLRHYRRRPIPDESFVQTMLLNGTGLIAENNNRRYTDWFIPGLHAKHPRSLGTADLPAAVASGAHFARKFDFDPALYDALDAQLAGNESVQASPARQSGARG